MARDPRLPPELPAANPYAAPSAVVADVLPGVSDAEAIRTAHIRHERQLKGIGSLYGLGAAIWLALGIATVVMAVMGRDGTNGAPALIGGAAVYLTLGALLAALATGYRRLRPWIRVPGGILAAIGLLAFPIGTLINAAILYVLFCAKGRTVLSPEYAAIVAATPHVKFRHTTGEKVVLWILGAILVGVGVMIYLAVRAR
ncbi:MAG TPA: hypothetical protein VFL14_03295 [Xanthomonadales bacterium]|nr:hypothetical protein [Xanthomonadales bacterium]